MMKKSFRSRLRKFWTEDAKPLLLLALILTAFRSAVADWNDVPTGSMNPTVIEGDRVFVNKLAYDLKVPFTTWHLAQWDNPKRGDIVVLFSPVDGTRLLKRVVGLPGDTIEMANERLFINGQAAAYEPLPAETGADVPAGNYGVKLFARETAPDEANHPVMFLPAIPARRTFGPITVPAGRYFLMGDNRDNSNDSRYWGAVSRDKIVGRAVFVAISLDHQHYFAPRWRRFFTRLN
jgi:signal peptidase I